jgi:hypothetical protein
LTGVLEYTSNNTVAAPTWVAVNVVVQAPAGDAITATDSSAAPNTTPIVATAGAAANNTVAPLPKILTKGAAGALVINGLTVDTITPISGFAHVTNFTVRPLGGICAPSASANQTATDLAAGDATGAVGAGTAPTATAPGSAPNTITLTAATATTAPDWTTGPVADDIAAANSTACFNTGVIGTGLGGVVGTDGVPFAVNAGTTAPTYDHVFLPATGNNAPFNVALANNADDGVVPSVVGVTTSSPTGTTDLDVTFSEPMQFLNSPAQALREIAENMLLGTNSLAALNLNAGGNLSVSLFGPTNGQSTLRISGVQAADVGANTLNVNTGIALVEVNDAAHIAAVAAGTTTQVLDNFNGGDIGPDGVNLTGGLAAVRGNTDALRAPSGTALAIAAAPLTIDFAGADTTAQGFTGTDPTKVAVVTLTFATPIAFGPGKSATDLASNLVITVNGLAGNNPEQFQFHPPAAAITLGLGGSTMVIQVPTALVYANIDVLTRMEVEYLAAGVTNTVLVAASDPTVIVQQGADPTGSNFPGTERVTLPLTAVATTETLITQSIIGGVTVAAPLDTNGSRVRAYLAKFVDRPKTSTDLIRILSGNITNTGDSRVGTTLAIEFLDKGNLEDLIQDELDAVAPAKAAIPGVSNAVPARAVRPITVYVKLIRSNDTANAQGNGERDAQVYLQGRALLATTYDCAVGNTCDSYGSDDNLDPIYEVTLTPVVPAASATGVKTSLRITGRMTGTVVIESRTENEPYGLRFFDRFGEEHETAIAAGSVGETIVGTVNGVANSFNLLLGIDPQTTDFAQITSANAFVLLVHEQPGAASPFTMLTSGDPGATNFLKFTPNILNPFPATRTTLASINLANIRKLDVVPSNSWALYGVGSPSRGAVPAGQTWSFPRALIGVDALGNPKSFWSNDGDVADLGMTMAANSIKVATELDPTGQTLSTIVNPFGVNGAVAFGWANDIAGGLGEHIDVLQSATPPTPTFGTGWSLVAVPAGGLNTASLKAIIRVGAQATNQFTWISATDGAAPTLAPGEAVFINR